MISFQTCFDAVPRRKDGELLCKYPGMREEICHIRRQVGTCPRSGKGGSP